MTGAEVDPGRDHQPASRSTDPTGAAAADDPAPDARSWPIDLAVAIGVLGTLAFLFRITDDSWFYADEWNAGLRGWTVRDLIRPYNGHLSVTWIAIYRTFYGLFDFHHYWIVRLLAFAALTSVPALLYVTTRSRVGATLAGLAAVTLLWVPGTALDPGSMNHWIAGAVTVVIAWALPRSGRRSDLVVAGALALALATSGGGVAAGAACVVHTIVASSTWRRRLAVGLPLVAWALWWSHWGRSSSTLDARLEMDLVDLPAFVREGAFGAIREVAGGSTVAALALTAAFGALVVVRLRQRDRTALASLLGWGAATTVWWAGIGWNRGLFSDPGAYRYQWVTVLYVLLAVIWSTPAGWHPPPLLRPSRGVAVVVVVLLVLVGVHHDEVRDDADILADVSRGTRSTVLVAGARPPVVAPGVSYGISLGYLTQAEIEAVLAAYDVPGEGRRADLDRRLLAAGAIEAVPGPAPGPRCQPLEGPVPVPAGPGLQPPVVLGSRDGAATVSVRRFGQTFEEVVTIPAGRTIQVSFLPDAAEQPWTIRADGACRIG